jgi:hypothetical protein
MRSDRSLTSSTGEGISLSPVVGFGLVSVFTLGLFSFAFLTVVRQNLLFQWSFLGPSVALIGWSALVFGRAQRRGRLFTLRVLLRKQHYIQACAQGAFFLYWGWYWRPVYDSAFLIVAQLFFAYAFEMLLAWSRRTSYTLGFGPFPVIFSINLFLWFADEWFYLQFVLVALGFGAKEFIRWNKDGRRVHIFNPSSFPLAVASVCLIITGTTGITWGQDIAISQFYPPYIYVVLFLVALPGQYLFGVASMTMSAVLATYLFGLAYFAVTGVYFFYDSYIPIAVFLGMHLLFTDPSTAPRTDLGRILFGIFYGLSTVLLYVVLGRAGVPTFYDKLLFVPVLNLSVQLLDQVGRFRWLSRFDPARLVGDGRVTPHKLNFIYVGLWALTFSVMSVAQGVGDRHPGQWVPFWQSACNEGRPHACSYLTNMQFIFCRSGSAWACNEAGILHVQLTETDEDDTRRDPLEASVFFERGCERGFETACQNFDTLHTSLGPFEHAAPTLQDYPVILRGTKGPIMDHSPKLLYERACRQGWDDTCGLASND